MANPINVFEAFIKAINTHDVTGLTALMSPDHILVDSLGNRVEGRQSVEAGWRKYFSMCSDYWIHASHIAVDGDVVLAVGDAGGTIDGQTWAIPAAWQAVVRNGYLEEWRVFADNKPVYDILAERKGQF